MNQRNTHPHTPAPVPQFATCTALPPLLVGEPPAPEPVREDLRPLEKYALLRAAGVGWTRNETTHGVLQNLADAGLVRHLGTVIRRGPKDARGHYTRVFSGSQWDITEPGIVRLRELDDIDAPDPALETPTWEPAAIESSTREEAGVYRVQLVNGAKAVVCRAGTRPAQWRTGWGWADKHGAVTGLLTKADAMRSFREYRG